MNEMSFKNIFDKVFSSSNIGYKKPQKEFYQAIFKALKNINRNQIIFWDDTQSHIDGVREFGILAELYISFKDFKKKMKQHISCLFQICNKY